MVSLNRYAAIQNEKCCLTLGAKNKRWFFLNINDAAQISRSEVEDPLKYRYRKARMAHWNRVSKSKEDEKRLGAFYQKLLQHYYRSLIPPGMRILELGCCHGDLLASLNPSFGVGIDFSIKMWTYSWCRSTGDLWGRNALIPYSRSSSSSLTGVLITWNSSDSRLKHFTPIS